LSLNIGGEIFEHSFHVTNNLSTDMLIGDDFLSTFDACVQRGKKIFTLQNERVTVPLCVKGMNLGLAKIDQIVSIQPYTHQIVSISCTKDLINTVQMLEPIQNSAFLGIQIPRVLLSTIGQKYCPLWNYTDEIVTLTPGSIIGTVSPIQDILAVAQDNNPNTSYEIPPYRHPNRRYRRLAT